MTPEGPIDRVWDRVRAAELGGGQTADFDRRADEELLAALEAGTETLESADEETLARAIERFGMGAVSEALRLGTEARIAAAAVSDADEPASDAGGRVLDGRPWFRSGLFRVAVAAALLVGAVLLSDRVSRTASDVQVAWAELDAGSARIPSAPRTESLELVPESATPEWGVALRGAGGRLPDGLRRRVAVVHSGPSFGGAVLLDADGWMLTSSALVAEAVQGAAWDGDPARVEVELVELDVEGRATSRGGRRAATIYRHSPRRGLALLKLDEAVALAEPPLDLADGAPAGGSPVVIGTTSTSEVAGTLAGRVSGTRPLVELLAAHGAEARGVGPATVVTIEDAPYSLGSLGAPVFRIGDGGAAQLVGITVGGDDAATWCTLADDLRAVALPRPRAPEPFPIDPWLLPLLGARSVTRWDADGALPTSALVAHTEDLQGRTTTSIFLTRATPPPASEVPRGLPFDPASGGFPFDVFVTLDGPDRVALGVTDRRGVVARVWAGSTRDGVARVLWTPADDGGWTVTRPSGRVLGAGAWLSGAQNELLASALRALARR